MSDTLTCPDCSRPMVLRQSRFGLFYGCTGYPACRGTHGAHPDGSPLGVPADAETRRARIEAHEVFDRLWKEAPDLPCYQPRNARDLRHIRRVARGRAYAWLSAQLGHEAHISEMDVDACQRVIDLCEPADPSVVRDWHKSL